MAAPFILLFALALYIILVKPKYDFKTFLLTMKDQTTRQKNFFASHDKSVPIEVIYGKNTKNIETAREFEDKIDPKYFKKALEMFYDPKIQRPDITFFNMGAIGAYMGHLDIIKKCANRGIKYALVIEDNVIIKRKSLYEEVQKVIDTLGDRFEMCFFHSLSYKPVGVTGDLERVSWISGFKCHLVHVKNMEKFMKYYFPMDNHVDNKTEDIIARGARVYYKDMRDYIKIDSSGPSTIGHAGHGNPEFFSRRNPKLTSADLKWGYV